MYNTDYDDMAKLFPPLVQHPPQRRNVSKCKGVWDK